MRVAFRVIANRDVGTGHVYRALTLADTLGWDTDFLCWSLNVDLVKSIVGNRYVVNPKNTHPDVLIVDELDTCEELVWLRRGMYDCPFVHFEDIGTGAVRADLTINALYPERLIQGGNILWGPEWHILRDEFVGRQQLYFQKDVDSVLLAFGGTDPTNLSQKVLEAIMPIVQQHSLWVYMVAGPAYSHQESLERAIDRLRYDRLMHIHRTVSMAAIMSRVQIAFTSNGQTVYELAHMHVPSVVISNSERENTHTWANPENGFMNLGIYCEGWTEEMAAKSLEILCERDVRRAMFGMMLKHDFSGGAERVVAKIKEVVGDSCR